MKKLLQVAVLSLTAAVVTSQASVHAAGPPVARPFKGTAVGVVTSTDESGGFVLDYTGTATHLGRFKRTEFLQIAADGFSVSGLIVFVAANGDVLRAEFDGGFTSPNDVSGTYEVIGGTGRFEGATGSAVFDAYTPDLLNVAVVFSGTVTY